MAPRPVYVPSTFDVVTGRALDVQPTILPTSPPTSNMVDVAGRYQSFSLLIQPIPTRFELDEMCNLWDRDVTVYFDLHVGSTLLQPYLQGDTRGQIRSLNRQVLSRRRLRVNGRNKEFVSVADPIRNTLNGILSLGNFLMQASYLFFLNPFG